MARETAWTISSSLGNAHELRLATTLSSTAISKIPPLPFTSSASTFSFDFSAAAARTARAS
jgi:hypothetical protein